MSRDRLPVPEGETLSRPGLRERAEAELQRPESEVGPDTEDLLKVMHELEVHRIELEMQNEELRRAQADLQASRDRYAELYDLAPVAFLTLDRSCTIRQANVATAELLEVDGRGLPGRRLTSFMDEPDADTLQRHLREAFSTGAKCECDVQLGAAGEGLRSVRVHMIAPTYEGQGHALCRAAIVDLTDLKEAQRGLRTMHERSSTLLDIIPDAVVTSDEQGRIESFNRAAERLFGYEEGEVVGRNVRILMPPPYRDEHAGYLSNREPRSIGRPNRRVMGIRRDGTTFPMELGIGEWHDGGRRMFVAVIHDLSDRERAERELRQVQKMEALGVLASGVAHGFDNVLQAVLGCLTLAQKKGISPERVREHLDDAVGAVERGSRLADRLMGFIHKGHEPPSPVPLDPVVEDSARLLETLLTERFTLDVQTGASGSIIMGHPAQIEQILMNLAANARDAMPKGGTLSIRTETLAAKELATDPRLLREADRYVRVVVEDSGHGMDEDTRARIFEPFFTTKPPGKGTGLGLSAVFTITKELGGHIEVESAVGEGTRFVLHLPCHQGEAPGVSLDDDGSTALTGTVLLVEDEWLIRMAIRDYLEELGLDVLEAGDAEEAERAWHEIEGDVDMLVSDVVLPGVGGEVLATSLRARHPGLRVIFISANPRFLPDEITESGWATVLKKPFGKEQLVRAVVEAMGDASGGDSFDP